MVGFPVDETAIAQGDLSPVPELHLQSGYFFCINYICAMDDNKGRAVPPVVLNPWTLIWTNPEKALDFVFRYQREEFLHRLFMAYGFFFMLMVRLPDWMTAKPDPIGVMIQMFLVAPVIGITLGYVQASMLGQAYAWFGVPVDRKLIRPLVAWTSLPFMLAIVVFLATYVALSFRLEPITRGSIWIFSDREGWMSLAAGGVVALYAIWIRVRAISLLFTVGKFKAVLLWLASFLMTFIPFALVVYMFFSIFYATVVGPGQ